MILQVVKMEGPQETLASSETDADDTESGPDGSETDSNLTRDEVFKMLSNRRRRYVLHYLGRNDAPVSLRALAEQVAAWENGVEHDPTSDERKRVYTALQQFHLPRMDGAGVVEYDHHRGIVELTEAAERFDVYLDIVPKNDIPWGSYYAGLSTVGAVLLIGVSLGAYPFTVLSGGMWAVFFVTALCVSSLVHLWDTHRMKLGVDDAPHGIEPR
jgi:hypothetical protein